MNRLQTVRVFQWVIALSVVFIVLLYVFPNDVLVTALNGGFLGMVVALMLVYTPLFWKSLRAKQFDRVSQLALGIGCIWAAQFIGRVTSVASHVLSWPDLLFQGWPVVLTAFLALVGAVLHVTAAQTTAETNILGVRHRIIIAASMILAGGVAVMVFYFQHSRYAFGG